MSNPLTDMELLETKATLEGYLETLETMRDAMAGDGYDHARLHLCALIGELNRILEAEGMA